MTLLLQAVEKIYSSSEELSKIPQVCFTKESDSITLHWKAPQGWIISSAYDPAEVSNNYTHVTTSKVKTFR